MEVYEVQMSFNWFVLWVAVVGILFGYILGYKSAFRNFRKLLGDISKLSLHHYSGSPITIPDSGPKKSNIFKRIFNFLRSVKIVFIRRDGKEKKQMSPKDEC